MFQTDKPNKKFYSITDSGRQELQSWLAMSCLENEFQTRSVFLMKLFFSGENDVKENIAMLREYEARCLEELADLEKTDCSIEAYKQSVANEQSAVYWRLTARYGVLHIRMCVDFAKEAIRTLEYLSHVRKAGEEYWQQGSFSQDVQDKLNELLYPPEVYTAMADASWEIEEINRASPSSDDAPKDMSYPFLRQMAALYHSDLYTKDIVLEMHFTDLNKAYQLLLGKEKCTIETEHFTPCTTRIETPFHIWLEISEGKIDGMEATTKGLYHVSGDLDTMIIMDDFLGSQKPVGTTPYERIGAFSVTLIGLIVVVTGGSSWQFTAWFSKWYPKKIAGGK